MPVTTSNAAEKGTTRSGAEEPAAGDLTPHLIATDVWSDHLLVQAGIPVVDARLVTVGGGLGSFLLADRLLMSGAPAGDVRVLSDLDVPWQTYEHLARVSQVSGPEREQVLGGLRREHERIGYPELLAKGTVRMVRRRQGGGYFTVLTPPAGTTPTPRVVYRSQFVHLAVGYAGLKFLPDLQRYRADTGDHHRVVNAYEGHEHVYREVAARPCTVVLRGSDPVGERIVKRLTDDRERLRTGVRIVRAGFGRPRPQTDRRLHQQLRKGTQEGWYQLVNGEAQLLRTHGHRLSMMLTPGALEMGCDFVIDCTGMETDIAQHRVLDDLLGHGGARRNPVNRLAMERSFEVHGTRNGIGRIYASGAVTLSTPSTAAPGPDVIAGLRTAAQEITRDLVRQGFAQRPGPGRAARQWWRRTRNQRP